MRLLYTTTDGGIAWTKDIIRSEDMPRYAILSHTWGEQEVTFDDLRSLGSMNDVEARNEAIARKREGWDKIRFCAAQAKHDGIDHFWVDTCCIDKANNTELSEAINSMFRWYQNSQKCYVFLTDVKGKSSDETGEPSSRWKAAFKTSRWFTRGWTLQELLAPRLVEFFAADGAWLGDKESMEQVIHEVTRIPIEALSGSDLSAFNVDVRLSWALSRQTTREEDGAYCLLGIFDCHLPLIYGEGKESAFKRLRKEIQGEERLRKISSWLLAPDPTINYHKAHEQRQANTGLWLLEGAGFKRWKLSAASKLWLYGIPGCGKTILSSTIIEHLQQYCDEDDRMVTVYFYFDFNDAQKRDPGLMLRSLLRQLLEHSVMIPEGVDALFSSCGNGRQPPSVYALLEVAPQVIRMFTHVYVVLDALDECTQRPQLMDMLETMFGWQLGTLHLLVTSRKERDIEMSLENYVKKDEIICLQSDVVDQDISLFVQERLREDKRLAKWKMNARIVQEIEATLMRGARGMFRWAVCQLDTLARCRNLTTLRKSLAALPPTLDQTYDRILTAISEDDCVYAKRILQWLTFSTRPLYLEEIAEAVAIDVTREPGFDRDEVLVDPLEALDICSSLVAITTYETGNRWRPHKRIIALAHYSVQEYLISDRIKQGPSEQYSMQEVESHEALARACLIYLNQIPRNFVPEFDQFDFELAQYSAESWYKHVQKTGDETEEVIRLAMRLFSMLNPAYRNWKELHNRSLDLPWGEWSCSDRDQQAPLYSAALLGLTKISGLLLDQGADVNVSGGYYGSAIQAASIGGHSALVGLLIDAGADVNASSTDFQSALHAALSGAYESTVMLLLKAGASVGLDKDFRGAIHHAVDNARCTPSLVSILQDHSAATDTFDVASMTPLHYCVKWGHETIAKHLIDRGVPVDSRSYPSEWGWNRDVHYYKSGQTGTPPMTRQYYVTGHTPLHFAALQGSLKMTRFLLDRGADPNAVSKDGNTPLHLTLCLQARERISYEPDRTPSGKPGKEILIQKLITSGADPSRHNLNQETPLHLAIAAGDYASVIALLSGGANVAMVDKHGHNSLHCAARYGHHDIIVAIVETAGTRNVDIIASRDNQGQNVLHHIFHGEIPQVKTVQWLLDHGADGSALDNSGTSPLAKYIQTSTWALDIEICRSLLKSKGTASLVDRHGQTLGHLCTMRSDFGVQILQALHEYDVDLSARDCDGRTVLYRAAMHGHLDEQSLVFLGDCVGIDLDEEDNFGRTALQYVVEQAERSRSTGDYGSWASWDTIRYMLLEYQAENMSKTYMSISQRY